MSESSWRPACLTWFERGVFVSEVFVVRSASAFATARKMNAKITPWRTQTARFVRSLIFEILTFSAAFGKPGPVWGSARVARAAERVLAIANVPCALFTVEKTRALPRLKFDVRG